MPVEKFYQATGELMVKASDYDALAAELKIWKPMTPEEIERELESVTPEPLSEDRINELVAFATDPANRLPEPEYVRMAAEHRRLTAHNSRLIAACEAAKDRMTKTRDGLIEFINSGHFSEEQLDNGANQLDAYGTVIDQLTAALETTK